MPVVPAYRIFVSSPGDVGREREMARKVCARVEGRLGGRLKTTPRARPSGTPSRGSAGAGSSTRRPDPSRPPSTDTPASPSSRPSWRSTSSTWRGSTMPRSAASTCRLPPPWACRRGQEARPTAACRPSRWSTSRCSSAALRRATKCSVCCARASAAPRADLRRQRLGQELPAARGRALPWLIRPQASSREWTAGASCSSSPRIRWRAATCSTVSPTRCSFPPAACVAVPAAVPRDAKLVRRRGEVGAPGGALDWRTVERRRGRNFFHLRRRRNPAAPTALPAAETPPRNGTSHVALAA